MYKPRKKIYKVLDSASHMKGILNAVNEGVITFDTSLKIIMVNRFALNLWGYSREQILGKNISTLLAAPYSKSIIKYYENNILVDKINNIDHNTAIKGIHKNGKTFPISLNIVENKVEDDFYYTVAIKDLYETVKNKEIQNCIVKISNSVRISTNLKELYCDICKYLNKLVPTKYFSIVLLREDKKLDYFYHKKLSEPLLKVIDIKSDIAELIINKSKAEIYTYEQIEYFKDKQHLNINAETPNSYIGVPLIINKKIIGVVSIQSFDTNIIYDIEHLNILKFISDQIAIAIDKVKSVEEMHYLAYYDKLTNLPNRILFNDRAELAFKNAKRENNTYCILFLDLDEFKIVNDTLGHNAGDKFLKIISKRLIESVREGDTISHWGGDEFTILSKISDIKDCEKLCERILKNTNKNTVINKQKMNCSVSIGAATFPRDGRTIETLIEKADMAMYLSKTHGKNTFTIYNNKLNENIIKKLNNEIKIRKKIQEVNN